MNKFYKTVIQVPEHLREESLLLILSKNLMKLQIKILQLVRLGNTDQLWFFPCLNIFNGFKKEKKDDNLTYVKKASTAELIEK